MSAKEDAVQAAAEAIGLGMALRKSAQELARDALEAAEEKWPHKALEKDITGSTNGSYERAWAPVHRFGFGKPTAC